MFMRMSYCSLAVLRADEHILQTTFNVALDRDILFGLHVKQLRSFPQNMAWWIYEKSDGSSKSDNVLDVKSHAVAKREICTQLRKTQGSSFSEIIEQGFV
jgi:hypothetical protein